MVIFGVLKLKSKVQKLIEDLYADEFEVRVRAALELANMKESVVEPLIENLKTVKSIPLKGGSPEPLAAIGEPAIEPLVRILKDSESTEMARLGTTMAFAKMTDGASASLIGVLIDKAVEPLIKTLSRSDCKGLTFVSICTALGRIGDSRAIEPIKTAIEATKDAWLKNVAREALEKIQTKQK
jgi:HEAT repeat protein